MPTPNYGKGGEYLRDQLVQKYGEASVLRAEISICIQLLIMNNVISGSNFIELLEHLLNKNEDRRRSAAGFRD
jgi:hypothetical protein